jgi:carboxymethylenebutenolidase
MGTVFSEPSERQRIMSMVGSVTAEMAVRDARAYVEYLTSLPEVAGTAVGTTGYCMGEQLSLSSVFAWWSRRRSPCCSTHTG